MTLDKEKKKAQEPERMLFAKKQIESLGYLVFQLDQNTLIFQYNDHDIKFYPFTGWATGKTIKDGRGLNNLLKQITNE